MSVNRYPRVMRDLATDWWFVAGSTGPVSWRYHKHRWSARVELAWMTWGRPVAVAAGAFAAAGAIAVDVFRAWELWR